MSDAFRVMIHAEVELAAIDGSTSWLISISRAFAMAGAQVEVVARNVPAREIVLDEIRASGASVTFPNAQDYNDPRLVAKYIAHRHRQRNDDIVIIRGESTALELARSGDVRGALWYYLAGLPRTFTPSDMPGIERARDIARHARGVFAQTVWLRDYVNAVVPEARGKIEVLPPMVPDEFFRPRRHRSASSKLVLGYAGKFDAPWHTLEIPQLPEKLRDRGVEATVVMHGDKVQAAKDDPRWHLKMRALIDEPPPGVSFPGALKRPDVARFMAKCDVGIGWRDRRLDTSYEISTKLLEFSAAGVPVACNDTVIHRSIFGEDYPLFVRDDIDSVANSIATWHASRYSRTDLSARVADAVRTFSISETSVRLRALIKNLRDRPSVDLTRDLSAGYVHSGGALSGLGIGLIERAEIGSVTEVPTYSKGGVARLAQQSDVIFVEFSRRALSSVTASKRAPLVALAMGDAVEHGLANAYRLGSLAGFVSADPALVGAVRLAAPHCRTLLLNSMVPATPVPEDSSLGHHRFVSIVVKRLDLHGVSLLRDLLPTALSAASRQCPVRIVLMADSESAGSAPSPSSSQFVRELHLVLSRYGGADIEVLSVSKSDSRWLRDTALLIDLMSNADSHWVLGEIGRYGGSVLINHGHRVQSSQPVALERHLTPEAVSRANSRRNQSIRGGDSGDVLRFRTFVQSIVKGWESRPHHS